MTAVTAALTPWYRRGAGRAGSSPEEQGSLAATRILDRESVTVLARMLVDRILRRVAA